MFRKQVKIRALPDKSKLVVKKSFWEALRSGTNLQLHLKHGTFGFQISICQCNTSQQCRNECRALHDLVVLGATGGCGSAASPVTDDTLS